MNTKPPWLEAAIHFMENHLQSPCSIQDIAVHVHLSPAHFSRLFLAATGEKPGEYLRKRRMNLAASALLSTRTSILDIAFLYQYESQEAFSRSFKTVYGVMPGSFRKRGCHPWLTRKEKLAGSRLEHRLSQVVLQPAIQEWDSPRWAIGLCTKTSVENSRIPWLWEQFLSRKQEIQEQLPSGANYGISIYEKHLTLQDMDETTEYLEIACCETAAAAQPPAGMTKYKIPEGLYAVFIHKGPVATMTDTYNYIFGTWLFQSPYQLDHRDTFEQYSTDYYGSDHPDSLTRIFLPIQLS